jgi:hypothetical protein
MATFFELLEEMTVPLDDLPEALEVLPESFEMLEELFDFFPEELLSSSSEELDREYSDSSSLGLDDVLSSPQAVKSIAIPTHAQNTFFNVNCINSSVAI